MNKIRILIVDDSLFFRKLLTDHLSVYEEIEVVGCAVNANDANQKIQLLKPDVVTLDIEMPGTNGIDFLKELLPRYPIPVVLVSSLNINLFDALSAGAVDFVRKPSSSGDYGLLAFLTTLRAKLTVAKSAKVRLSSAGRLVSIPAEKEAPLPLKPMIIAIGASTGGTEAILSVLKGLPAKVPPIVITQHMPPGFTDMYAQRLDRLTPLKVREARQGDLLSEGLALIAPGGLQMKVVKGPQGYCVSCYPGERIHGLAPSVDVLFHSVAETAGANSVGILLTGMGRDGADGLLHMREKGAYTIGQDKESCVVYGMPMEAHKQGAVCRQAPLGAIPALLMNYLAKQA